MVNVNSNGWSIELQTWKIFKAEFSGPIRPILGAKYIKPNGEEGFARFKYRLAEMIIRHTNGKSIKFRFCDKSEPKITVITTGLAAEPTIRIGVGKLKRTVHDRLTQTQNENAGVKSVMKETKTAYSLTAFEGYILQRWGAFGREILSHFENEGYMVRMVVDKKAA